MKLTNIIALSTIAILSLASCEMKNELTGSLVSKEDEGAIELGVSVKQPVSQTRAEAVATNNFPVTIQGTSTGVTDVLKEYATADEVPSSITVPVGNYTVSSHTPGTLEKKMDAPYYAGSTDITVSKGVTSQVDVVCRMANSRIQMQYGDDFKEAFSEWTITVDDGSDMALTYTQDNLTPDAIYWHFGEDVTTITVNIKAKTTEGNTVTERQSFKKADAAENYEEVGDAFTGGDALEINMGTVESSTGDLTGITITTNITFENESESVEIPTTDPDEPEEPGEGGDEPVEPGENSVTLNLPADVTYSIGNAPASADAYIASEAGIESIIVQIVPGNTLFEEALNQYDLLKPLLTGADLVGNDNFFLLLSTLTGSQMEVPQQGDKEYTFQIGAFFNFLDLMGPTDTDTPHIFNITVTDANKESATGSLRVTVNE